MHTFTDNQNRSWNISLNVYQMKRLRAALGLDLVNVITLDKSGAVKVDLLDRIANDPCLLVDILWVICEAEAHERGVSDIDFGCALAGDSIESATKAFLEELVDFFPGARRLFLKKAVELAIRYTAETTAALEKALASPELEKKLDETLTPASAPTSEATEAATTAPEPPAATPEQIAAPTSEATPSSTSSPASAA